jgi:hypothetical protein
MLQAGRVSVDEPLLDVLQHDLGYRSDDVDTQHTSASSSTTATTTASDVRVRLLQVAKRSRYSSSDSIKVSTVTSGSKINQSNLCGNSARCILRST